MGYNSSKGPQQMGDIQFESDPDDVQIDFSADFIALKTGGGQTFIVSGTAGVDSNITGSAERTVFAIGANRPQAFRIGTTADDHANTILRVDTSAEHVYSSAPYKWRIGSRTVAPTHEFSVSGDMSGSGILHIDGAATFASSVAATGTLSASEITASLGISASYIMGDGSRLTGISAGGGGISFNGSTADGLVTYGGASTADVEATLLYDGTELKVGQSTAVGISGSGQLEIVGATRIGSTLDVTGNITTVGDISAANALLQNAGTLGCSADPDMITFNGNATPPTLDLGPGVTLKAVAVSASSWTHTEGPATFSSTIATTGSVSGSSTLEVVGATVLGSTLSVSGTSTFAGAMGITASHGISASFFMGDGSRLTGISAGGGGISFNGSTANGLVTYGGASTADVETQLTFDGAELKIGSNTLCNLSASNDATIVGATTLADTLVISGNTGIGLSSPQTALDVHHNPTSLANDTGGGEVVTFGAGTTVAGVTYYLHSSSNWYETSIQVAASGGLGLLATALGTNPAVDGMLVRGFFDYDTALEGTFSPGATVYLSSSGGGLTVNAPSGSGQNLRVVGHCTTTANVIYFNPSGDYITIV